MIALGQLYRKLPYFYFVEFRLMELREGFSSFRLAVYYRSASAKHWDPVGCFWEEINSGWYREYIYPYDGWYNAMISKERQLRLGQRGRWPSSSL